MLSSLAFNVRAAPTAAVHVMHRACFTSKLHAGEAVVRAANRAAGSALIAPGNVATGAGVPGTSMLSAPSSAGLHFSAAARKSSHPGRKYFADVRPSFVVDEVAEVGPRLSVP